MSVAADALLAARLCAIDPGLGGLVLRGDGEARDAALALLGETFPMRRLPVSADEDTLDGGVDFAASLAAGRRIERPGLIAASAGGLIVAPMAERMAAGTAARLAEALDVGAVTVAALDDGIDDERPPATLVERLAFSVDCRQPEAGSAEAATEPVRYDEAVEALASATLALGIDSARALKFALRAARAAVALDGRQAMTEADVALAARLVLAPRATRVPAEMPPPPEADDAPAESQGDPEPLADIVLEAALAALPPDVLAALAAGGSRASARTRGAGERRRGAGGGRPVGTRAGLPRGGVRLALVDTLRAAAPWQRLRGASEHGGDRRVRLRKDDLRVRRLEARAEATTIVAVDASGSAALARLAEAKGAVELLLAQAYVKRAQVALVAFRGTGAETLLPPTRSLARARRSLADLPGGGGTPLAAGLAAAHALAEEARRRGRTPFVVVLTDGRANVALDGGRAGADADAEAAARAIGAAGIAGAFVDISARPRAEGERLAAAMRARYLPLPRADAHALHTAIAGAQP